MPIFTQKEYEKKKKDNIFSSINSEKEDDRLIGDVKRSSSKIKNKIVSKEKTFKYWLLHPENSANGDYQNFEDVIKIGEKEYKRSCKNGVVVTTEKVLAEFLLYKKYILLEKKEII